MARLVLSGAYGECDGVNVEFETPSDYVTGTLRVWRNGNFVTPGGVDGWQETGLRSFKMATPPSNGDRIDVVYGPR